MNEGANVGKGSDASSLGSNITWMQFLYQHHLDKPYIDGSLSMVDVNKLIKQAIRL